MKLRLVLTITLWMMASYVLATETDAPRPKVRSVVNDEFVGVHIPLQDYREILGGSVFKINYAEDCPENLRGAFDYAAKIWEEYLPDFYPISITVDVDHLLDSALSNVTFTCTEFEGETISKFAYPISVVKSVLLKEYNRGISHRFDDYMGDRWDMLLEDNDITITYNLDKFDEMYFGLEEILCNKYDFVTLAIRDIARGLGFATDFVVYPDLEILKIPTHKITPYQSCVLAALTKTNSSPKYAYYAATSEWLDVDFKNSPLSNTSTQSLVLYAPYEWSPGISLNSVIPQEDNPLERVLDFRFGKGYIMRDLSGWDWNQAFDEMLDWWTDFLTGSGSTIRYTGASSDNLPYEGNVDFSDLFPSYEWMLSNAPLSTASNISTYNDSPSSKERLTFINMAPYGHMSGGTFECGLEISALLKNGQWDKLKSVFSYGSPYLEETSFDIEALPLHYADEMYARGTGGGLRYRILSAVRKANHLSHLPTHDITVHYYTRDFTPQVARIGYSGYRDTNINEVSALSDDWDEYYVDVPIDISNIEGTDEIMVIQHEEGMKYPFYSMVYDIRKGYFVANVARDVPSTISVIAYNQNGSTRSNEIVIPAVGFPDLEPSFVREDNFIRVEGIPSVIGQRIHYTITDAVVGTVQQNSNLNTDGSVDIGNLSNGFYILHLEDGKHMNASYKFVK